ncbi:MAG: hypothetical protein HKN94_13045 [Acidimicrobiales bacterium]|nr:hypothetical protein [Acidimicrobiia bacterium]NNC81067.1 hypothetical protein [Acidimicrobiales bacterium]RZV45860.1 MAG: hypothetical protein EX269_08770 [Acidimicrobiales bacterium]
MADLLQQLESYGDQLEESIEPVEFTPPGSASRWPLMLAVAAALFIIVGLTFWLFPGDDNAGRVITDEVPALTTTTVESTTSTSTPEVSSTAAVVDAWEEQTVWSGFEWGRVRTIRFEPDLSFVAPELSGKTFFCPESATGFAIEPDRPGATPGVGSAVLRFRRLNAGSLEETVEQIQLSAASSTAPRPTTVGGVDAITFDAEPGEGAIVDTDPDKLNCHLIWDFGPAWRFWVVDVDGDVVTIALMVGKTPEPLTLEGAAELLEPVVDSVQWRVLASDG